MLFRQLMSPCLTKSIGRVMSYECWKVDNLREKNRVWHGFLFIVVGLQTKISQVIVGRFKKIQLI